MKQSAIALTVLTFIAVGAFASTPTVGPVAAAPSTIASRQPTTVTITAVITDPTVLPTGVNLLRIGPGGTSTILGQLHDDGTNGDAAAGDQTYTLQVTFNEAAAGQIQLQVSAAFKGVLKRVLSNTIPITVSADTPTITASVSPLPNAAGWNNSDATVTFTCSDPGGTVSSCSPPVKVSTEGANQVISGTVRNSAGNSATTSVTINLDKTPPNITAQSSPASNAAGWNNSNPTVSFACTDSLSGIAACPAPQTITNETIGLVVSGTATDIAGNTANASVTINLDKTSPVVTVSSPANNSLLPVGATAAAITGTDLDSVSGVLSVTCNGTPASRAGANFSCNAPVSAGSSSVSVQATDIAGNKGAASVNLVFPVVPTVIITSPANLSFTNLSPVTVNGMVSDPASVLTINGMPVQQNGSFSIPVPLVEGGNVIGAVATSAGGGSGTATVQVTLDTTPPHLSIDSPSDQSLTTDAAVTVVGSVNDIVPGTVNDQDAQVTINGVSAQVANRSYLAANVPLAIGPNVIQAVGKDRAGNGTTTSITITRVSPTQPPSPGIGQPAVTDSLTATSGNNQTAVIASQLPSPLAVVLRDASRQPVANGTVVFKVTGNDGMLSSGGSGGPSVTVNTDANGFAQAFWTLGNRSGAGVNRVEASSALAIAPVEFNAVGLPGTPTQIVIDSGENQTGTAGQALTFPLGIVVTDAGHNRIANVPVTFTAIVGGGTLNGAPSQVITTDSNGRALATLALGPNAGNGNNTVEATFPGAAASVAFTASGRLAGDPAQTTISGVVLDNTSTPIPNSTIRLFQIDQASTNNLPTQIGASVLTDAQGHFTMPGAPVGYFKLMADGSTAGAFPTLEYDLTTVSGQDNNVGSPIYLPLLNGSQICVDETHGGTLQLLQYPGFSLSLAAGSATFPGGARSGCVSVSVVHGDKVPMAPGFGQQPRFIVTIQPVGTMFNPPAAMTLPNVDGLKPRAKTEMYSYDHDLGMFVAIGTATVSDDGSLISSDPGTGVLKAGWHCGGDPNASGQVADCPDCLVCSGKQCVSDSTQDLKPCNGGTQSHYDINLANNSVETGKTVTVAIDNSCKGQCVPGVGCTPSPQGFNVPDIKDAVDEALQRIFNDDPSTACIGNNDFRATVQAAILKQPEVVINCNPNPTNSDGTPNSTVCAYAPSFGSNFFYLTPAAMSGNCGTLTADIFHEMMHTFGQDHGAPDSLYHNIVHDKDHPFDCRDRVYGCQEACYGGTENDSTRANILACAEDPTSLNQAALAGGKGTGCQQCRPITFTDANGVQRTETVCPSN
jgi:hypothetical protein